MILDFITNALSSPQLIIALILLLSYALLEPLMHHKVPIDVKGPTRWPIVGQMPWFISFARAGKTPDLFAYLYKKYGSFCVFPLFMEEAVVVTDAAECKRILESPDFVRDDNFEKRAAGVLDHALFTIPSGEKWKKHRKFLQPAFGPGYLRHTAEVAKSLVDVVANDFRKQLMSSKQIEVDINGYFTALAMDLIGKIAFSFAFDSIQAIGTQDYQIERDNINKLIKINAQRLGLPPLFWTFLGIGSKSPAVVREASFLKHRMTAIINEHKLALQNGRTEKTNWDMDVLDRLLKGNAVPGQEKFTHDEIIGELVGFFLAGNETTANTMTFMTLELCKNPDIMKKLVAEIDKVYEELNGDITPENLHQFKYLDCVFRETQRYHPVVPLLAKTSTMPVTVMGHDVAENTRCFLNIQQLHLSDKYWDNPDVFDPERMTTPEKIVPGSFLPFGLGPHACIGLKLATIEAKCVLIHMLRQFSISMVPDQKIDKCGATTQSLRYGLRVHVTERNI